MLFRCCTAIFALVSDAKRTGTPVPLTHSTDTPKRGAEQGAPAQNPHYQYVLFHCILLLRIYCIDQGQSSAPSMDQNILLRIGAVILDESATLQDTFPVGDCYRLPQTGSNVLRGTALWNNRMCTDTIFFVSL